VCSLAAGRQSGTESPATAHRLKDAEVTVTQYSLISYPNTRDNHPKSWCLEVSSDGRTWTEVHHCAHNNDFNESNRVGTYQVSMVMAARFVRPRQTGKAHWNKDYLLICSFEVFGTITQH
jgi:hypothetical protein